jgi:hypothetical protein
MRDVGINSITGNVVVNVTRRIMSNLYMTTEEFAAMVVDTLHEQNYFKKGSKNHPADIVIAFTSTAESIASALDWAIQKEYQAKADKHKEVPVTYSANNVPLVQDKYLSKDSLGYSEWKRDGYL